MRAIRAIRAVMAVAVASGALVLVGTLPADAGAPNVINVTTTVDEVSANGQTSFREAVTLANLANDDPQSIVLAPAQTYNLTRCGGADGDLDHTAAEALTIIGNGARVFQDCPGERVIQKQSTTGLLLIQGTELTEGDAGGEGGVAYAAGDMQVQNSTGSFNKSFSDGGALGAGDDLVIQDSSFGGSADGDGGAAWAGDTLTARRSSFSGSAADGVGGALRSEGAMTLENVTIIRNRAAQHGGASAGGGMTVSYSTIVANYAPTVSSNLGGSAATIYGSIVGLGSGSPDCSQAGVMVGANVSNDGSCGAAGVGDEPGLHPHLGVRVDDGTVDGHPLVTPSPGLDIITPTCVQADDAFENPRPAGAGCDSGAVEAVPPSCTQQFDDVPASHPFFDEICWMAQTDITQGFGEGLFQPGAPVTRQSMSAFIFRLALLPFIPAPPVPSFSDIGVSQATPFFRDIQWMAFEGIAGGFPDGTFRGTLPVTRQAMAAFMYRVAGEPAFSPGPPAFSDVPADHPFFTEIEWLASEGVTTGFPGGTFKPGQAITRQAMAAFMLRLAQDVPLDGL